MFYIYLYLLKLHNKQQQKANGLQEDHDLFLLLSLSFSLLLSLAHLPLIHTLKSQHHKWCWTELASIGATQKGHFTANIMAAVAASSSEFDVA